jgi:TonB family protein
MKFRPAVLLGILFIAAISTQAQAQTAPITGAPEDPAKIAAIHRLLDVMGLKEHLSRITPTMMRQIAEIRELAGGADPSATRSPRDEKRQEILREVSVAKFQSLDFVALLVPIYDQHYTLDEINALIVFYQSPAGQKTLQLEQEISLETQRALAPAVVRIVNETEEQVRREHPELYSGNDPSPAFGGVRGGVIGGVVGGVATDAPPPPPPPPGSGQKPMRVVKGGDVAAASATNKVAPIYPELARQARVEGTVRLHTVIDTDGRVIDVNYISGPPMLVQSAIDSVKQWRFKPTILNGVPVQVECVIEINFRLAK